MGRTLKEFKRRFLNTFDLRVRELSCGYCGGLLMLVTAIAVRLLAGSPYRVYLMLRGTRILPPIFFLMLFNLLFSMELGFACGLVLVRGRKQMRELKYRAGLLSVLLALCWFFVYPLIFRGCMLTAALLLLMAAWGLTCACMILYFRICLFSGWLTACFLVWQTYLVISLAGCILWF